MSQKYQKQVQHKPDKVTSFYFQYSNARREEHQNKIVEIPFRSTYYYTTYAQKFGDVMWSACTLLLWREGNVVKLGYCRQSKGFPFIKQREPIIRRIINLNHIVEVACIGDRQMSLYLKEGQEKQWQLKFESRQIRFKWAIVLIMLLYNNLLSRHLPAGLNKMINQINGNKYQEKQNLSNKSIQKSGKRWSQSNNNQSEKKTNQTKRQAENSKAQNEQMTLLAEDKHIDLSNKLNLKMVEIAQLNELIMKLQANEAKLNEQIRKLRSQLGKKLVQKEIRDYCNNPSQSTKLQEQVDIMRNQMKQQLVKNSKTKNDYLLLKQQNSQLKVKLESMRKEPVSVQMERQVTQQLNMVRQALDKETQKLRVKSSQCEKLSHEIGLVQKKYDYMLKEKQEKQNLIREYEQKIFRLQGDVHNKTKEENNKLLEQIQKNKELNMKLTAAYQDIKKLKLTNNGQLNALRGQKQAIEQALKNLQLQCQQLRRRLKDSEEKLQQSERFRLRLQLQKQQAQQQLDSSYKRVQMQLTIHIDQADKLKRQMSKQKDDMKNSFAFTIKMLDDQIKQANAKIRFYQQKIQKTQMENSKLRDKDKFNKQMQQSMRLINLLEQKDIERSQAFFDSILLENISLIQPQNNQFTQSNIKSMIFVKNSRQTQTINQHHRNKLDSQLQNQNAQLKKQLNSITQQLHNSIQKIGQYQKLIQTKNEQLNTLAKQFNLLQKQKNKLTLQLKIMQQKNSKIQEHSKEDFQNLSTQLFEQKKYTHRQQMNSFSLKKQLSRATIQCQIMKEQIQKLTENNHLYEQEIQMLRQSSPSKRYHESKEESPGLKSKVKKQLIPNLEEDKDILQ